MRINKLKAECEPRILKVWGLRNKGTKCTVVVVAMATRMFHDNQDVATANSATIT